MKIRAFSNACFLKVLNNATTPYIISFEVGYGDTSPSTIPKYLNPLEKDSVTFIALSVSQRTLGAPYFNVLKVKNMASDRQYISKQVSLQDDDVGVSVSGTYEKPTMSYVSLAPYFNQHTTYVC